MNTFNPLIRHALHFALKHHDGQTRKYRNAPYIAHPVQVALILTRYDRPDEEVIAGILHDVVEDCAHTNAAADDLARRIRDKFGAGVLAIVLGVTEPKRDENDQKIAPALRRQAYLKGLEAAPVGSLWVCAADKIQNANELALDVDHARDEERKRGVPAADADDVWSRFSDGKEKTVAWYRLVHAKLESLGFHEPIMEELDRAAALLERHLAIPA